MPLKDFESTANCGLKDLPTFTSNRNSCWWCDGDGGGDDVFFYNFFRYRSHLSRGRRQGARGAA